MAKFGFLAVLALFAVLAAGSVQAADPDPHTLSAAEQRVFFPLVCRKPIQHDKEMNCAGVIGYDPSAPITYPVNLTLETVFTGALTRPGADEAYVSYSASFEAHVTNFGGGILFARKAGKWKLVRWYPAGQMDRCVALPPDGHAQRMLCLTFYAQSGEVDSSAWVDRVGNRSGTADGVLAGQDDRGEGVENPIGNYQCELPRRPGEAILLSIDDLTRSHAPGILAQSHVVYVTARDADRACRRKAFAAVRTSKGIVRYRLQGNRVVAAGPAPFAATDH